MADPIGEDAWASLIEEGRKAASDLEARVEVVETCKRALDAEPYSLKLWLVYCEWMWVLFSSCHEEDDTWQEDELPLGQEIFSEETCLEIWRQAVSATSLSLSNSHLIWNRWIDIELERLAKSPGQAGIDYVRELFLERLQVPHATWDETSQKFSTFSTKYEEASWEENMVRASQLSQRAKDLYSQRELHEINLQNALSSGQSEETLAVARPYLEWEELQSRKKKTGDPQLGCALYERVLLSLHLNAGLWQDYASFIGGCLEFSGQSVGLPDLQSLLKRAVAHCPWSGDLWERLILQAEIDNATSEELEQVKDAALESNQLDRDGLGDVVSFYSAWCNHLRRRASCETREEADVTKAESEIPAAIQDVLTWGKRLYGKDYYANDPQFRLESCWIHYLTERGELDRARSQWKNMVKTNGDNYEFWQRYYLWEMTVHGSNSACSYASAVLRQAISRKTLDWPEKILQIYSRYCEVYEETESLLSALNFIHRSTRKVVKRRQQEAEQAAAYRISEAQGDATTIVADLEPSPSSTTKRKRDSVSEEGQSASKKMKADEDDQTQQLKRDRENTTVFVTNLPADVAFNKVRQYFKEYGHINNAVLKPDSDGTSSTALIEFKSVEDVQSVLLKDGKYFVDRQIRVKPATGCTLYVTNYPPAADEGFMRKLFEDCGEIFNIRWPSLKFNAHRRFCYITFRSAAAGAAATRLDGKMLEGRYKLLAKYSDPQHKKSREGPVEEGREIHVTQIDLTAVEADLKEIFGKYGTVESAKILRSMSGKSHGNGFVVFETKESAIEALALDKTKFRSQILGVEISVPAKYKPTSTSGVGKGSSASPAPDRDGDAVTATGSPVPQVLKPDTSVARGPSRDEISSRTIALINIPDTVNDARIRAIAAPFGDIVKLVLRPDHQGALVEYSNVADAGKASLGLENYEITPGRKLRIGTAKDLFQEKSEYRSDRIQSGPAAKKPPTSSLMPAPPPVRRPGGRGGLGTKRGLGFGAVGQLQKKSQNNGDAAGGEIKAESRGAPKSNADFKAMLVKSKDS